MITDANNDKNVIELCILVNNKKYLSGLLISGL